MKFVSSVAQINVFINISNKFENCSENQIGTVTPKSEWQSHVKFEVGRTEMKTNSSICLILWRFSVNDVIHNRSRNNIAVFRCHLNYALKANISYCSLLRKIVERSKREMRRKKRKWNNKYCEKYRK